MHPSISAGASFAQKKDPQRVGTKSPLVEQVDFLAVRKPCPPVDKPRLLALQSFRQALRYSYQLADLEPKQVFDPLGMDKATWSRIENGSQAFPPDCFEKLAAITGNDAPLIWLAYHRGYDLRPLKSELEEQLEAERAARLEAERQNALMRELLMGRK